MYGGWYYVLQQCLFLQDAEAERVRVSQPPDTAEEVIEETAAVETEQETGVAEEAVNETITVTECDVSSLNAQPVTEGEYALNEDIKYMLGQLETDYNKVNWDSRICPL